MVNDVERLLTAQSSAQVGGPFTDNLSIRQRWAGFMRSAARPSDEWGLAAGHCWLVLVSRSEDSSNPLDAGHRVKGVLSGKLQ